MPKKETTSDDPRRGLPSVSRVLESTVFRDILREYPRPMVVETVRNVLARLRADWSSEGASPDLENLASLIREEIIEQEFDRTRPVVNATGVILHTNLGRAVLPQKAVDALAGLNRCVNLQIDLSTGKRGKRCHTAEQLLARLTGAEAALVVNNNAAATFLVLAALCKGREVIISRGQLIEIGGSFRLPDCIHQSGAIMVEVGTTNKTHLADYERAITENTGIILRVNPSNYRIVGFSKEVPIGDLAALREKHPVIVADDLGCGALIDLTPYGLPPEKTVQASIAAGADLAFFSGDKLIGGPQAGIIVGRKDLIAMIKKHPLTRLLRVCKLTDLALEHTLRLFLDPDTLVENHPTLRMLATPVESVRRRADDLAKALEGRVPGLKIQVVESESETGGGSLPGVVIPSYALSVQMKRENADMLSHYLRRNEPPIIGRISEERVLLDMRTVLDGEEKIIAGALEKIGSSCP
jgi:L-seryl-tRNA(Ser) seleniumtransferase